MGDFGEFANESSRSQLEVFFTEGTDGVPGLGKRVQAILEIVVAAYLHSWSPLPNSLFAHQEYLLKVPYYKLATRVFSKDGVIVLLLVFLFLRSGGVGIDDVLTVKELFHSLVKPVMDIHIHVMLAASAAAQPLKGEMVYPPSLKRRIRIINCYVNRREDIRQDGDTIDNEEAPDRVLPIVCLYSSGYAGSPRKF